VKHQLAISVVLLALAIVWKILFGWLRHRSFLKHRASGFVPGTQHLSLIGTFGALLLAAAAFALLTFAKH